MTQSERVWIVRGLRIAAKERFNASLDDALGYVERQARRDEAAEFRRLANKIQARHQGRKAEQV